MVGGGLEKDGKFPIFFSFFYDSVPKGTLCFDLKFDFGISQLILMVET